MVDPLISPSPETKQQRKHAFDNEYEVSGLGNRIQYMTLKVLTISSSRLPLLFFPIVFARPFVGEGGFDLTGVPMGDGVVGEVC